MTNIEHLTIQNLSDTPAYRAGSLMRRAAAECARVGAPSDLEFVVHDQGFVLNWTMSTTTLRWTDCDDEIGYSMAVSISGDDAYMHVGNRLTTDNDYASPSFILAMAALEWLTNEAEA